MRLSSSTLPEGSLIISRSLCAKGKLEGITFSCLLISIEIEILSLSSHFLYLTLICIVGSIFLLKP